MIPLHVACAYGRSDVVRHFLAYKSCDVNCSDGNKDTALHILARSNYGYASLEKRIEISKMLISAGADCYAQNNRGNTPAHIALYEQNVELFNEMMEFSANIKVVSNVRGDTLMHAAIRGSLPHKDLEKVVVNLVKRNPDLLEYRNRKGFCPIMAACVTMQSFHLEIFASAHQNGLKMRSSLEKYTLLHIAVLSSNVDAINWLLNRSDQDSFFFQYSVDYHGHTPLHLVRKLECVKALHFNGYDMNVQDSSGNTLLHILVKSSYLESNENKALIQFVLANCDTNLKNTMGLTPLHLAWKMKKYKLAKFMIANDEVLLDISNFNDKGDSLLHLCLQQESDINKDILKHLVKKPEHWQCQNNKLDTPLHIAAEKSSLEVLSLFSDFSAGPYNSKGLSPFQVAVGCRTVDVLVSLSESCHPDFTSKTRHGDSLLHIAAALNSLEVVKFMSCFLDINVTNSNLEIALHSAVRTSNYEVIEYLLAERQCDPSLPNIHGRSSIHLSAYLNDLKTLGLVFSHFPHLTSLPCTINGDSILHIAAKINSVESLKCYLPQVDVNSVNNTLETPLFTAIKNGCMEAANVLVHWKGIKVNIRNGDGESPLHLALKGENMGIIQTLLEFSACDFEIKSSMKGHTMPLKYLSQLKNVEIAKQVISTFVTENGSTLLHLASQYNITDIFSYLKFPTLINCLDHNRNTPLHIAVMKGHAETLKYILSLPEVDVNILNNNNRSAFDLAVDRGLVNLVEPLWNTGKFYPISTLQSFVADGRTEVLKFILSKNIDINMENTNGDTLLHLAIIQGNVSAVKLIVKEKNCSLRQANKQGNTPLHLTCSLLNKEASLDIAKTLLTAGRGREICPNCINNEGKTPAQLATENYGILHQLSNFLDITTHNKLESFVKVLVVGQPEVGKSHLIEAIAIDAKNNFMTRWQKVQQASRLTAGITCKQIRNRNFGSAVLYEFAGQPEFYNSNIAILENLSKSTPPLFLVVVSLNNPDSSIIENMCYWLKFIENQCAISKGNYTASPHVIFALSFYDVFKKGKRNLSELIGHAKKKIACLFPNPKYEFSEDSIVALDCRMLSSPGLKKLNGFLSETCQILRVEENDDFICTYFNAFLKDKFKDQVALQVKNIEDDIKEDNFLTQDTYEIMRLLSTLHDKDQILLLRNNDSPGNSWIVFDKNALMSEIQGSIFSPKEFENYFELAESTGVVHLSRIRECFKHYDPYMIAGVLSHLEYCSLIRDPKAYSIITKKHPTLKEKEYYFFPSLVKESAPSRQDIWTECEQLPVYGFLYEPSTNSTELYLNRVMHILILRIAFSFALGSNTDPAASPVLFRRCSIWKDGIAWYKQGIQIIIEFSLQTNRMSVILKLSDPSTGLKIQATKVMHELSRVIQEALNEFCPSQILSEYVLDPNCINYPMLATIENNECKTVKFLLDDMIFSVYNNIQTSGYVECSSGLKGRKISSLLPFELFLNSSNRLINLILQPSSSRLKSISIADVKKQFIHDSQLDKLQMERIEVFFCAFIKSLQNSHSCQLEHMTASFKKFSILSRKLPNKVRSELKAQV